jgi:CRISPR-associated protein Csx10
MANQAATTYRLTITAHSPLSFSHRLPGGIFQESLPYVPGTALRGAAAKLLLSGAMASHQTEEHHTLSETCDFCRLFLSDEAAIFTNAYPVTKAGQIPYILPATAVSCKSKPGFGVAGENTHGVFDTLIDQLCWAIFRPAGLLYAPNCPCCRERVEGFSGVFSRTNGFYHRHTISQRLLTRVGINRRRAVAEPGFLYSPWVLEEVNRHEDKKYHPISCFDQNTDTPPQVSRHEDKKYHPTCFVGHLRRAEASLKQAADDLTAIGGRNSTGLGQIKVVVEPETPEEWTAVEERTAQFNTAIHEVGAVYQTLGGAGELGGGDYFALTLQSDAILRRLDGLPTMVLEADLLRRAANGALATASLVRSYATYDYIGGWHGAWQMPKPAEICTRRGSVFLFHAPDGLTDADYQALAGLQQTGVGERREEGFGQVRVCDEFHQVRRDRPV